MNDNSRRQTNGKGKVMTCDSKIKEKSELQSKVNRKPNTKEEIMTNFLESVRKASKEGPDYKKVEYTFEGPVAKALASWLYDSGHNPSYAALAQISGLSVEALKKRMENTGVLMLFHWQQAIGLEPEGILLMSLGALLEGDEHAAMRPAARAFLSNLDELSQKGALRWDTRRLWENGYGTKGAYLEHFLDS